MWEGDAVCGVVLALTDRSPIPSPCPDESFGISFIPQYRSLHLESEQAGRPHSMDFTGHSGDSWIGIFRIVLP